MNSCEWKEKLAGIKEDFISSVSKTGPEDIEQLELRFFGRKGHLSGMLRILKDFPLAERKAMGAMGNSVKKEMVEALALRRGRLGARKPAAEKASLDLTLPGFPFPKGSLHPLTIIMDRLAESFLKLGFTMAESPLIEDDFHNFAALNFPPEHPARDMQDTFYLRLKDGLDKDLLLRTHTSPAQIRAMQACKPPLRVFHAGRVFRSEAVDASHSFAFHQIEGLYVDKNVCMADLKWTVDVFMKDLFGPDIKTRFLPSYFPFVEPGAEVEITCVFCGRAPGRCPVCKGTGWIELLGAGIIHPNVIKACGHDPEKWSGFAFGAGIERFAMLLFGIEDMRMFYQNDMRILGQL